MIDTDELRGRLAEWDEDTDGELHELADELCDEIDRLRELLAEANDALDRWVLETSGTDNDLITKIDAALKEDR